jgi:hypothetical protein
MTNTWQSRSNSESIPEGVKPWEKNKGGWRRDKRNINYFLSWEELLEFERRNEVTYDDDEFYEWYDEFRKTRGIKANTGGFLARSESTGVTWETEEKKKGGWLSSWWSKDFTGSYGSWGDNKTTKLALAMKAIRSVIRVVDDTLPQMTVKWSDSETGESYTSFNERVIVVNPKPITAGKLDDGAAIDVCTGFALHEASHSQHSRKPYETLTKPTELSPMQIAGLLLNVAEDVRIEAETSKEYPGFSEYFQRVLSWVWDEYKEFPKSYGPDLQSKVNTMILACRWEENTRKKLTAKLDPAFPTEIDWWTKWRDDYLNGVYDSRVTVEHGLEHLREKTEDEKAAGKESQSGAEMDQMSKDEEAMKKAAASLKDFIDKAIEQGRKLGKGMVCVSDNNDKDALNREQARKVQQLVDENLETDKPTVPAPSGMSVPPIHIRHPLEDGESRRLFIGKPAPILQKLKAALVFRQELPRYDDRLLKEGQIDDDELWRFGAKDYRVFHEERVVNRPKVQLGMLVDMSGSMLGGRKLQTAQELAQLLLMSAKDMDGVSPVVWGHTGDNGQVQCTIFRIWDQGEPVTRLGLISSQEHGNNYDGFAIDWCAKQLINRGDADEQRVLLVLSDGYPAGSGYGGAQAELHMRQVGDWAARQGVSVIQIAIDEAVRPERQAAMFKEWVQFTNMGELPRKLAKLLEKHT